MSHRKRTEESDLEEIRKGFEMFDVNNEGMIDPLELIEAMDAMNLKDKNPFIYEVIESICDEKEFKRKGGVTLDDLVNYVYNKLNDSESNNGIRQIFDAISDHNTDTVSMSTFYQLVRDYGDQLSEDELRYLLDKTQMSGEELTFDDFHAIMKATEQNMQEKKPSEVYHKKPSSNSRSSRIANKKNKKEEENDKPLNVSESSKRNKKFTTTSRYEEKIEKEEKNDDVDYSSSSNTNNNRKRNKYSNKNRNYESPKNEAKVAVPQQMVEDEVNYEAEEKIYDQPEPEKISSYRKVRIEQRVPKYGKVAEENVIDMNMDMNMENMDMNMNMNNLEPEEEEEQPVGDESQPVEEMEQVEEQIEEQIEKYPDLENVERDGEPSPDQMINENLDIEGGEEEIYREGLTDGGNYREEKETKITKLPGGGREIEVIERKEEIIETQKPSNRGSRYRNNKNYKEAEVVSDDNTNKQSQESKSSYIVKRPKGTADKSSSNDENDKVKTVTTTTKVETVEKKEEVIPRRYHRRYRENKTSTDV